MFGDVAQKKGSRYLWYYNWEVEDGEVAGHLFLRSDSADNIIRCIRNAAPGNTDKGKGKKQEVLVFDNENKKKA